MGRTWPRAVRIVRPVLQPSRLRAPNRAAWRTMSRDDTSAASCPDTALAITRLRLWARPSCRRSRQCAAASAWLNTGLTQTSPARTSTGQVGTSSAQRSKVHPLARSKRAMVPGAGQDAILNASTLEREAHMRAAVVYGRDPAPIIDDEDWTMRTVQNQPPLGPQLGE